MNFLLILALVTASILSSLLTINAEVEVTPFEKLTEAIFLDDPDEVERILSASYRDNPNSARNESGWTALHLAAHYGSRKVVDLLLHKGTNVTAETLYTREQPLHVATWGHHPDVVQILLDRAGTSETRARLISAVDSTGRTALCIAAQIGNKQIGRHLLMASDRPEKAALFDETSCPFGSPQRIGNPLHVAVIYNQAEFVNFLLNNGRKFLAKTTDSAKSTALHIAAYREAQIFNKKPRSANYPILHDSAPNPADISPEHRHSPLVISLFIGTIQDAPGDTIGSLLIQKGADLEAVDQDQRTPFLAAAGVGAVLYGRFLHKSGANVSAVDGRGFTAFHIASDTKMLAFLMELVMLKQMKHDINTKSQPCPGCLEPGGLTPLQVAVIERKPVETMIFLLHHNALIEPQDDMGDTAVHIALKSNNTDALALLLERPNVFDVLRLPDSSGKKPLQVAVEYGSLEMARLILRASDTPNATMEEALRLLETTKKSPLQEAVVRRNYHAFKMVMESADNGDINWDKRLHAAIAINELTRVKELLTEHFHDNFNIQNETGWSPLHVATIYDSMDIVEYLLSHGANITLPTVKGELPLHTAIWGNSWKSVAALLAANTNEANLVEAEQSDGQTPIFYAGRQPPTDKSSHEPFTAASRLLESFANIEHVDRRGMMPIHEAVAANQRQFAEFLVKNGVKLTAKCCPPDGKTAFHVAAEMNSVAVFDGPLFDLLNETALDNYEQGPVCTAAAFGSVEFARKLFEASKASDGKIEEITAPCPYVGTLDLRDGGDPIHVAVVSNQLRFINFLLDYAGEELMASVDAGGRSLLHVAALRTKNQSWADDDVVGALLEKGADIEAKDTKGRTPFLFAIDRSALRYAQFLQLKGADASAVDLEGFNAFHIANDGETVAMLLQLQLINALKHDINAKSSRCQETPRPSEQCLLTHGFTPLHVAVLKKKNINLVRYLVNNKAELDATTDFDQTAFHLAVKVDNIDALNVLLKKLNSTSMLAIRDANGDTALHLAVKLNNVGALKAMLGAGGADVSSLLSGDGLTPLHEAILARNYGIVELLLQRGAQVGALDVYGRSALRLAVRSDSDVDVTLFKLVLTYAANESSAIDISDNLYGDTALHRAVDLELTKLIDLLLSNGANCSKRNYKGMTPLHIAVATGFGPVAKQLLTFDACNPLAVVDGSDKSILEDELMRKIAPDFVEETLLETTSNCSVVARKIQLALKMGALRFAETILQTMAESVCGSTEVAINHINVDGYSAFHTALIIGKWEATNWCLQNGARMSKRSANGRSAITLGLFGNLTERVVVFLERLTKTLVDEQTACIVPDLELKLATSTRRDLIRLLIHNDGLLFLNAVDHANGNTPLHYLAAIADVQSAKDIIANGRISLDTNAVSKAGLTALHVNALAAGRESIEFMRLLLDFGADVTLPSTLVTIEGDSELLALHIAASRCGNSDSLDILVYYAIHQFEHHSAVTFLSRVSTKFGRTTSYLAAKNHQIDLYMRMVEVFEYFRSWGKQPVRSIFILPNIRAIMPLPSGRQAVVVCYNGDVMGITTDCQSVLWRSKVHPPRDFIGEYQGIYHAALDSITKHVYFSFHHPMREAGIFYTTLNRLVEESNDVVLEPLLPNGTDTSEHQFLALYVDAERETILANDPWVRHQIAAYSLADGKYMNTSSVFAPSIERFEPLFCAISRPSPPVVNTDSGPRLLAVSDHNHRVHVFTRKEDGKDGSMETKYAATIAEEDHNNPNRLGAVFYPADLTFDHLGNLFVADYLNRRLQIFSAADLTDLTSLRAVWTTDKLRSEVQRVAVAISKNFTATALVGLESGHVLCFKHRHGF